MSEPRPDAPPDLSEAAAWFVRLGQRSVTTQSLRDFRAWRQDPANDAAYQEIEAAWRKSGSLANDPDVLRATEAVLARRTRRPGVSRPWLPRLGWTVALAGLAIAGAAIFGLPQLQPAYSTAVGEQRLVRLEDGSRIRLNTDSRVRVAFSRGERRLVLARGEAYFDVAHDARRPFIVQAGDASVRALGTRFDVRRDAGQVRVTLLEGRVRVRHDGQPRSWTLAPDQQLTLSAGGAGTTRTADGASATSWTTGRLVFHETPLAAAIAEVNRYSDRKVALDAQGLSGRLVNGVFDVGDTDSFVRGVAALFELKATAAPDGSIRLQAARHADAA